MAYSSYNEKEPIQEKETRPFYETFSAIGDEEIKREEENWKDLECMKKMYPQRMQRIQEKIEEECDKLEYEGSMMFDEYPDRGILRGLCNKIYDSVKDIEETEKVEAMENGRFLGGPEPAIPPGRPMPPPPPPRPGRPMPPPRPGRPMPPPPPPRPIPGGPGPVIPQPSKPNNWLQDIIQVLLYNEMYNRRCRHRNSQCRRWGNK